MMLEKGRGRRRDSRVRMGMWKDAVSMAQRRRKKRYWRRMGWEARREGEVAASGGDRGVLLLVGLLGVEGKGGGGESGRAGEEGVAFSMRAQVR